MLWYFTSIANRAGLDLAVLCQRVTRDISDWDAVEPGFGSFGDFEAAYTDEVATQLSSQMTLLADTAGEIVRHLRLGNLTWNRDAVSADLVHDFEPAGGRQAIAAPEIWDPLLDILAR
ncbi:MAG: hypothetical protein ABI877_12745 [Gemmatimonadaceae bacterium]